MKLTGLVLKVGAVVLVGVLMAVVITLSFGNVRLEPSKDFTAAFADVSGLTTGMDVRAAGVPIGRVDDLSLQRDNTIEVQFSVSEDIPVTAGTRAAVRYKNLIGDRYLELTQGPGLPLPDGGSLPIGQTSPALDLDELFNAFTPLFQGLAPEQINELSGSLIQILQGQGSSVQSLLAQVSALTNGLADRDQLIGDVVNNLNGVLDVANRRAPQVTDLIDQLQRLVSGFAADRAQLGDGIERVNQLAATVAGYVPRLRPELRGTINQIDRLSQVINADAANLNNDLKQFPGYYNTLNRLGAGSSSFSFFICGASLYFGPEIGATPVFPDQTGGNGTPRCQF